MIDEAREEYDASLLVHRDEAAVADAVVVAVQLELELDRSSGLSSPH